MASDKIPTVAQSMAELVDINHSIAKNILPQQAMIGVIESPPPNIAVRINNILLTKEDLYISDYWLTNHRRTAKGHIVSETQPRSGGSGMPSFASHTHDIDNDYTDTIITTDTYKVGQRVIVTPIEDQGEQLYYLGEVVRKL